MASPQLSSLPLERPAREAQPRVEPRLRPHLRAVTRMGLLGLAGLMMVGLHGVAGLFEWPAPRLAARFHRFATRVSSRALARCSGMRVRVEGRPPDVPHMLVTNHLSYLDVVALAAQQSGLFVAKSEVAGWPLVGIIGRLTGTVFVERRRKRDLLRVIATMEEALRAGENVIFFPEGTTSAGDVVLPFHSSLFEASARSGRPVACATLRYATGCPQAPASQAVCWWGDMTFFDHLYRLLQLPAIDARLRYVEGSLWDANRKVMARAARETVLEHFEPVPDETPQVDGAVEATLDATGGTERA